MKTSVDVNEATSFQLQHLLGLTQAEAAELLQVTVRTVQRRWHAALLKLHDILKDHAPEQ